jgi:hypothetical protein
LHITDVHGAPDTGLAARCETNRVADLVDRFADPIDPAKAERFVNRFLPRDSWSPSALLIVPDPELGGIPMIALEPAMEMRWRLEEFE